MSQVTQHFNRNNIKKDCDHQSCWYLGRPTDVHDPTTSWCHHDIMTSSWRDDGSTDGTRVKITKYIKSRCAIGESETRGKIGKDRRIITDFYRYNATPWENFWDIFEIFGKLFLFPLSFLSYTLMPHFKYFFLQLKNHKSKYNFVGPESHCLLLDQRLIKCMYAKGRL